MVLMYNLFFVQQMFFLYNMFLVCVESRIYVSDHYNSVHLCKYFTCNKANLEDVCGRCVQCNINQACASVFMQKNTNS